MTDKDLLYEVENHVATITINREAQRNAISPDALTRFHEYLDSAEADESLRVVCITGSGEKAFCSGADLAGGLGGDGDSQGLFDRYARLISRLAAFPKPTVARVNGYCLAGGMGLMLACDIVIAADSARFGMPEINVGLWPMMISALVHRHLTPKQALPLMMSGTPFTAAQAYDWGLISAVAPAAELDDAVAAMATNLAAKSPLVLKIGKNAYRNMQELPLAKALVYLQEQLALVASTADAREGMRAFREKRPPRFSGQ